MINSLRIRRTRRDARWPEFDKRQSGSGQQSFSPASLQSMAAWFRLGQGVTVATGVSQWSDRSGNGRHLLQATATNQPALQADGSILFDGTDNFLKCSAFTLNQPETVYLLVKQLTWTDNDTIYDGEATDSGVLYQDGVTPGIRQYAGAAGAISSSLVLGNYAAVCAVFNGVSSVLQVNTVTETATNTGAANLGGFTLGVRGDAVQSFSHIQVKEVLIYAVAHDAATRAKVIAYLQTL